MGKTRIGIVFILLLFLLSLRFFFFYQNQPQYQGGQYISFETTLLSEPRIIGTQQRLSANLGTGQRILIKTLSYPQFHYGDTVRISSTIKSKVISNGKPMLVMYFPKIEAVKSRQNLLLAITSFIRQNVISLFSKTLPPTSASLLLGIVFGIKESMPDKFTDNLRISGVMHVVAASGMNVIIVGGFLSSIFAFFLKRQIAILLSIIGILFYAVLAGLEPSILRASIMGVLVFSAQILGRQNLSLYGLFLAGYLMFFFSPNIIFDIGFQLSFLATLGLLYIRPIFERNKKINLVIKRSVIGQELTTTIAAQVGTLPILLANFGIYSFWSVVVNGLVLWTIPTLMVVGGIGAILGIIFPLAGQLILYLSLPFLLYFEKIVMFFGKQGAIIKAQNIPWQFLVGYYFLLVAVILLNRHSGEERSDDSRIRFSQSIRDSGQARMTKSRS